MAAPMQDNNADLNNNGIPDKFEYTEQVDLQNFQHQGNAFDDAYTSEEQIAKNIPDYKSYQWFREPNEGYFYSYGQKLENKIESGAITPEMLPEGSDIQKEAEQLYDNNPHNDEVNNEAIQNWFSVKDREAEGIKMPSGEDNNFAYDYDDEEAIKQYIPNYKDYKWYQQPTTGKFYSLGEKLENAIETNNAEDVENIIESNPEALQEVVDADNGISQNDVEPLAKEVNQLSDNNHYNNEINNEAVNDTIKEINNDSFFDNFLEEQKSKIDEKPKVDNSLIEEQRAALEFEENKKHAYDDDHNIVDFYDLVSEITSNGTPWEDSKVDSIYKYYNKRMSKFGPGKQRKELYDKMIRSMMNEIQKHPEEYAEAIDNFEGSIGLSAYLGKAINYDTDSNWHTRQNLVDENELFDFSHNLFDMEKLKREGFTTNEAFEISNDPLAYIATNNKGSEKLRAIWDEEAAKAGMPSYSDLVKEFSNQKDDAATFRNFAKGQISRDELINGLKEKGNYKAALVATKLSDKDLQNDNLVKYVMRSFRSRKSDEQNEKLIDNAVKEYKKGRTKELFDELGIDEKEYKEFVKEKERIGFELGDSYTKDFEMVDNPNDLPAISSGNQLANIENNNSKDVIEVDYTVISDVADNADKEELEEIKKEKDPKKKMHKLHNISKKFQDEPSFSKKQPTEKTSSRSNNSFAKGSSGGGITPGSVKAAPSTSSRSNNSFAKGSSGGGITPGSVKAAPKIGDTILKSPIISGSAKFPNVDTDRVNKFEGKSSSNAQKAVNEAGADIKQSNSKKDIKTGKVALPSGDSNGSSGGSGKLSLKDDINVSSIKERIILLSKSWESDEEGNRTSKNKYLPFKFIVKDDFVGVSQVGSGIKRQSIESFIKKNPGAIKMLQKMLF